MKKFYYIVLMLCSLLAQAQYTNVTATPHDPNGANYGNGTFSISWLPPYGIAPTIPATAGDGSSFPKTISGTLDGSGFFSATVADSNQISPTRSQWTVLICPPLGFTGCTTFVGPITGASEDLSPQLSANAPVITSQQVTGLPQNCLGGNGIINCLTDLQVNGSSLLGPTCDTTKEIPQYGPNPSNANIVQWFCVPEYGVNNSLLINPAVAQSINCATGGPCITLNTNGTLPGITVKSGNNIVFSVDASGNVLVNSVQAIGSAGQLFKQQNAPSTPTTGFDTVYVDLATKRLATKDDAGTVTVYNAGGGATITGTNNQVVAVSGSNGVGVTGLETNTSTGQVTKYSNVATTINANATNGLASEVGFNTQIGLTAPLGATTVYAVPASPQTNLYRVTVYAKITVAGSGGTSPKLNINISWNDGTAGNGVTCNGSGISLTSGISCTAGLFFANGSTNIQYATTITGTPTTNPTYTTYAIVEQY